MDERTEYGDDPGNGSARSAPALIPQHIAGDTTDDTRFQRTVVMAEVCGSDVTSLF